MVDKTLQSGLIQGKNPRVLARELNKKVESSIFNAERLMRTELARVQTAAQQKSFEANGFEEYEYIANSRCCEACQALDGKHFKVKDMLPGENAAPIHPQCRCSVAAYSDRKEYDEWLDFLANGGTTEEYYRLKKSKVDKSVGSGIINTDRMFHKFDADPMAEVFGRAENSNPVEWANIQNELDLMGVKTVVTENTIGYQSNEIGKPGTLCYTPNSSYSARLHEYIHAIDDMECGWNGSRAIWDTKEYIRREQNAYSAEIELAKSYGRYDIAEKLEKIMDKAIEDIKKRDEIYAADFKQNKK